MTDHPHDRQRVSDWAYQRLRDGIFRRELTGGERLSVPALAEQLQVSRSPVREAVQRLIREGLAEDEPHRGAVVSKLDSEDLKTLYDVREVLEGLACRLAALAMSDQQLADLREQWTDHARAVSAGDLETHAVADQSFHRRIRLATRNPWVIEYLDRIQGQVLLAMSSTVVSGGPERALRDHEAILEALEARRPDEAETAARAHIARLRAALGRTHTSQGTEPVKPGETRSLRNY